MAKKALSDDEDKDSSPTKAKIEKKKEEIKASVGVKTAKQLKKDDAKKKKEDEAKDPKDAKKKDEKKETSVKKEDESVDEMEVETDEEAASMTKKKDKKGAEEKKKEEAEKQVPRKSCGERVAELKTSVYQKMPSRPTFRMP